MRTSLQSLAKLALALVSLVPFIFVWASTDAQPMTVDVRSSIETESSVFLAHFSPDTLADVTRAHFSVESKNVLRPVCDRVYYLGPASSGSIELVGYSLTNSSLFQRFMQLSEPLDAGHALVGTPLPFAAVVCSTAFSLDDAPVLFANSDDGSLVTNYTTNPVPHAPQSDLCHRIAVKVTTEHEPTADQIDDAAVDVIAAVDSAFSRFVSVGGGDNFFSYTAAETVLRVCYNSAPVPDEAAIGQLVVSSVYADASSSIVSSLVVPALQPYLGAATTAGPATSASAPWSEIGFKCPARTHIVGDDPKASRCVYERCTSPPVLASPIGCYLGTTEVLEDECGDRERPVPPPQRDCGDVGVVDVGINRVITPDDNVQQITLKLYFTSETDLSLDDFPLITVDVGLAGFDTSTITELISFGSGPAGTNVFTPLPFDQVTFTPTSIVIDLSANPTHVIGLSCTVPPGADPPVGVFFASRRVYLRRSRTLLYTSELTPSAPGVIALNPETGKREMLVTGRSEVPWEPIVDYDVFSVVVLQGSHFGSTRCSVAGMPSQATIAEEIEKGGSVTVIPKKWNEGVTISASSDSMLALTPAFPLVRGVSPQFTVRCVLDDSTVVEKAAQIFLRQDFGFGICSIDFTEELPIPNDFVGQFHFNLGAEESEAVAAALADAFSLPGNNAAVKVIGKSDVESGKGSHVAALRLPPLTSFLLPSAETLAAAFPSLSGTQLVLPEGANATDVPRADLYQAVEEGHWLCGSDGSYNQCDIAVADCGDSYSAPLHCVQPSAAIASAAAPDASAIACAFDETVLPPLPQTAGCGALLCKLPGTDGAIVPCNDARVCLSLEGCAVDVAITEELISETEALQPVCAKGSDIVDMAFCPASLVPAVEHVSSCNATADCGAVCFSEATGKRVDCDDAWSSCSDACNGGTKTRTARCADTSVPIGDAAAPEVPVALCPNGELGVELSDTCDGDLAFCPGPTVTAAASVNEPGVYAVTWDDAAGKANVATGEALVELVPSGAAANDTIVLGTAPVSDFSLSFNVGELGIPAGVYTAVVTFDGVLRGESAEFDILSLCATECLNGGTCNTATGVCDCVGDWSGDACSISPCVAKGCNADGSTCSVDEGGFAQCECKGDWSGEACSVSPCDSKGCSDEHTSTCTVTPAGFAQCNCKGEWSGETCTQSPCVAKGCNPEGSECIVTEASTARCRCFTDHEGAPLFYGDKCNIPANYCEVQAPPCSNGGTRSGEFHSNGSFVCTDCACKQAWESATDCATCGLNCAHNTMANADCATCNCPIMGGYSGNLCECRSAYMTFIVRDKDVSQANINAAFDRIHGPDTGASFTEKLSLLFATDLASVTNIRSVQPAVTVATRTSPAGTRYYEIIFSVGPACNGVVPVQDDRMIPTYDAIVALKPFLSAGSHTKNNLVALSTLHVPSGFAAHDPNCQLGVRDCPSGWAGNGVFVEADGSLDCEGADAGNPACPDSTTKGGDSGLSTGAIVGIAVGGSVALILILLFVFWAAKLFCFAASKVDRGASAVAMASV